MVPTVTYRGAGASTRTLKFLGATTLTAGQPVAYTLDSNGDLACKRGDATTGFEFAGVYDGSKGTIASGTATHITIITPEVPSIVNLTVSGAADGEIINLGAGGTFTAGATTEGAEISTVIGVALGSTGADGTAPVLLCRI